ncbi:MAG: TIM barrel protein [Methanomassiliicoccales archaeon]
MYYFGPAGYPEGSKGPIDALGKIHDLGLNALEVQFVRQVMISEEKAKLIGEKAKELGILLSVHAPYYVNFNSANEETVKKSVEWVLKSARAAVAMGAWIVVIHAGTYASKTPEEATNAVIRGIMKCRKELGRSGEGVVLGLETMGRKGYWGTLDEISDVVKKVPGTCPVLDFAHLHARSNGGLKSQEDFEKIIEFSERIYPRHLHIHFSSVEFTDAGERRHLPLEAKSPNFELLADSLKKRSYDITIISETPLLDQDAVKMKNILLKSG